MKGGIGLNDVWYSSDGTNWAQATSNAPFNNRTGSGVVFENKMWFISSEKVLYSTDGVNWTQAVTSPFQSRENYSSVVFDNKIWVIGGESNQTYLNDVWYSSNGINWIQATASAQFSGRVSHTTIVYDNKMWVIGGSSKNNNMITPNSDVWSSSNGIDWTQVTIAMASGPRNEHASVAFNNKMWIISGGLSPVGSSIIPSDVWWSN
jgi:N-acetylneuraminic acid mutarotase